MCVYVSRYEMPMYVHIFDDNDDMQCVCVCVCVCMRKAKAENKQESFIFKGNTENTIMLTSEQLILRMFVEF